MGQPQSFQAHESMQNDLAHPTESARVIMNACALSYVRTTLYTYACSELNFDHNSSCRLRREQSYSMVKAMACSMTTGTALAQMSASINRNIRITGILRRHLIEATSLSDSGSRSGSRSLQLRLGDELELELGLALEPRVRARARGRGSPH